MHRSRCSGPARRASSEASYRCSRCRTKMSPASHAARETDTGHMMGAMRPQVAAAVGWLAVILSLSSAPAVAGASPSGDAVGCAGNPDWEAPAGEAHGLSSAGSGQLGAVTVEPLGPTRQRTPALWRGDWELLRQPPLEQRTDAAVAVDDEAAFGVAVWGGLSGDDRALNDGALYDWRTDAWMPMPTAPICPRRDFGWYDLGGSLLVYGGIDAEGRPLSDGAFFHDYAWTYIPPGPLPAGPAQVAGSLALSVDPTTGEAWVARIKFDGVPIGWWDAHLVPLPTGSQYEMLYLNDDEDTDRVLVVSHQPNGSALAAENDFTEIRLDSTDTTPTGWRPPYQVPLGPGHGGGPVRGWSVGREHASWVRPAGSAESSVSQFTSRALILDPHRPREPWKRSSPAPSGRAGEGALVLSPDHLIDFDSLLALEMASNSWQRLPEPPDGRPSGAAAWWLRGRLFVLGGTQPDGTMDTATFAAFTPETKRGTFALPDGHSPDSLSGCRGDAFVPSRGVWRLQGNANDPMRVWLEQDGRRLPTTWPDGFTVRFRPRLLVLAPGGRVVARAGDRYGDRVPSQLHPCILPSVAIF